MFKVGWAGYFNLFLFFPKHDAKSWEMKTEKGAVYCLASQKTTGKLVIHSSFCLFSFSTISCRWCKLYFQSVDEATSFKNFAFSLYLPCGVGFPNSLSLVMWLTLTNGLWRKKKPFSSGWRCFKIFLMWMIFTHFTGFVTILLLCYVLLCFLGPKTCGIKPAPPAAEGKSYPLDHQGSPQGGGFWRYCVSTSLLHFCHLACTSL